MLRACVRTDGLKWDKHLPLPEFSNNSSYQESIKMSPFKALYGQPCHTPFCSSESGERVIFGPDIVTEAEEKVKQIQANILAAQSHQKSYTNKRHRPIKSVCILSSTSMGEHLIKWSYHRSYRECIMCFMSPNSKDIWIPRPMLSFKIPFHWNRIWHTRHIPLGFSTNKTDSPATRLLGSIRFNGMIILKMKPHGNMKTFYDPTAPTFFREGNQLKTSPAFPLLQS
jgi:hypothetical protein